MRRSWKPARVGNAAGGLGAAVMIATTLAAAVPTAAQPASQPPPDARALLDSPSSPHGYDRLLRDFVVVVPAPDGAVATRFDYKRLLASPDQADRREDLRSRFLSAHPDGMDPSTRTAWAINAYNFLVIDAVATHYQEPDREPIHSIADIGSTSFAIFDDPWFQINGTPYSLNSFEKHFLFHDVDREAKKIPKDLDPRIHFALVCAAKGCPPLWLTPFQPETLDADLTTVTENALKLPSQLKDEGRIVHLSKIFEWYEADFAAYGGVAGFLERFAPPDVQKELAGAGSRVKLATDIEWDWTLNQP